MVPSVHTTSVPSRFELAVKLIVLLNIPPTMLVTVAVNIPQVALSPSELKAVVRTIPSLGLPDGH